MSNDNLKNMEIPKPWKYKEFLVWPNTVINVMDILDCQSTTKGICFSGKTINECIAEAKESGSGAGYVIKLKNGNTICTPIKTSVYPNINLNHNLRKQSIFPELDDVDVYTFINTKMFSYPVYNANIIYINDIVDLENVETGRTLDFETTEENKHPKFNLYMNNKISRPLQIIDFWNKEWRYYDKLTHNSQFTLSIPNSSLQLKISNNVLPGQLEASLLLNTVSAFKCIFINKPKSDKYITFSDIFALQYGEIGNYIVLHKQYGFLFLFYGDLSNMLSNDNQNFYFKFRFKSQMMGYYCKDDKCNQIPIYKTKSEGINAFYEGEKITRQQNCWGLCKPEKKLMMSKPYNPRINYKTLEIVLGVGILIVIISVLTYIYLRKLIRSH